MTHIAIQEALDGKPVDWLKRLATNNAGSESEVRVAQAVGRRQGSGVWRVRSDLPMVKLCRGKLVVR